MGQLFRDRGSWILGILFLLSIPLITSRLYSGDEIQYYAYLRSVWKDQDLQFRNEYNWIYQRAPQKQENFKRAFIDHPNPNGYTRNDAPVGCAILWAPFFAVADLYVKLTGAAPADGFSFPYIAMVCFASAFYGFLGFLLQYKIAKRFFGEWSAFWGVVTMWFGAHALFYMYVTPPMSHATSIFTTSLFLFAWLKIREKDSRGAWFALGIIGGLAATVRWQDALFLIIPILDRGSLRNKMILLLGAVVLFLPQLWVWQVLNGGLNPYTTGNLRGKFFWYGKYLIPVLFSTYHGLLLWTPVVALSIVGFYFLIRRNSSFALPVLVFVLQLFSIACLDTWQGGAGFGLRYLISCTAIFTLGLAALFGRFPRLLIPAVGAFFIVWNVFMIVQVSTGMLPRDGHFQVKTMIYNQFVRVPREIGHILKRYLYDRSSFYEGDGKESN